MMSALHRDLCKGFMSNKGEPGETTGEKQLIFYRISPHSLNKVEPKVTEHCH